MWIKAKSSVVLYIHQQAFAFIQDLLRSNNMPITFQ